MANDANDEYALEFLLGFDGRTHILERGYWLKFEIKRIEASPVRPHGLRYSFTLHDPAGRRLIGFDNAHGIEHLGARYRRPPDEYDHWHRTPHDLGRPYVYRGAGQLMDDFFDQVRRVLEEHGIGGAVIGEGSSHSEDEE